MSRHSKWSKIKRQKGVSDQKRGILFTKLGHIITIAAQQGVPDPEMNGKLRIAVEQARAANMPKDNIERAIARAKAKEGEALEQVSYEIVGPGGVGVVATTTTDNRNRTVGAIKAVLKNHDAALAGPNAVLWQFEPRGYLTLPRPATPAEREALELKAIDAGGIDVTETETALIIHTKPNEVEATKNKIEAEGVHVQDAELGLEPATTVAVTNAAASQRLEALITALEEIEEVDEVITNAA